jgi:hypothetical protein
MLVLSVFTVANSFASGREKPEPIIIRGPKGDRGAAGPQGATGPGLLGHVYTIPNGSMISLPSANGHLQLEAACNYSFGGDNEVLFFALDTSVTAGSVLVNMDLAGQVQSFSDLVYNGGGMDRGFPNTGYQGTWPWHGIFTANERGTLTRWEVFMNGASGQNCTATVFSFGGGTPSCLPSACL